MPQITWRKYFLDAQGYKCNHELQQDNTSATRLELNGKASSGKRTKHMAVRYFLIKDRVDAGDITTHHCSTGSMVGDFFTKPLQGVAFLRFRNLIMRNTAHDFSTDSSELIMPDTSDPRSVLGDNIQVVPADARAAYDDGISNPGKIPLMGIMRASRRAEEGWTTINRTRRNENRIRLKTASE